jgi:Fe-S cluster assembly iron-binding protein IscA
MDKKSIPDGYGLRIFVQDQGISCGATNYSIGFDTKSDTDLEYTIEGVPVLIKKMEAVHLAGLTLDYVTENDVQGFSFARKD